VCSSDLTRRSTAVGWAVGRLATDFDRAHAAELRAAGSAPL